MNIEYRIPNIEYRRKGLRQLHFGVHYSIFIICYSLAVCVLVSLWQKEVRFRFAQSKCQLKGE